MKILVNWDEKYPFPFISKLKNMINPKIETHDHKDNKWKLETENDILKMYWLSFYDIPDDKYNWIINTYKELDKINDYLSDIEDLQLKAKEKKNDRS